MEAKMKRFFETSNYKKSSSYKALEFVKLIISLVRYHRIQKNIGLVGYLNNRNNIEV